MWEADSGRMVFETTVEKDSKSAQRVHCLGFNPAGRRLAAACEQRIVRVWDAAEQRQVFDLATKSLIDTNREDERNESHRASCPSHRTRAAG